MIDNIRFYGSQSPIERDNEASTATIFYQNDFDNEATANTTFYNVTGSNTTGSTIDIVAENTVLRFDRAESDTTTEMQVQIKGVNYGTSTQYVVYDFDLKLQSVEDSLLARVKNTKGGSAGTGGYSNLCIIQKDTSTGKSALYFKNVATNVKVADLEVDTWYNIAVVYDYTGNSRKIYLNGEQLSQETTFALEETFKNLDPANTEIFAFASLKKTSDAYMIDNIRFYGSQSPIE